MTQKIRKAVFPAAGLGTRFLPATKAMPKEMLTLVDKPLIQYVVEEAVDSGVESIIIVTGRDKAAIENHFDISYELEQTLQERGKIESFEQVRSVADIARISYTRQKQPLGLGHAIYQGRDFVDNEEGFAVMLPDDIMDSDPPALKQMIDVFERYNAPIIATMQVEGSAISRFGVIDAEEVEENVFRIKDMVEKPKFEDAPSDLAIVGRYIFTPDIFGAIERTTAGAGGEIQITDAMRLLLKERPFYAVKLTGVRHDAGDKLGFLIATVELALKRSGLGDDFRKYLKSLNLASDSAAK